INFSSQISVVTKEQSDMFYQFIIGSPLDIFIDPYRVELLKVRLAILLPFGNQLNAAEVINSRRCFITKKAIQVIYHLAVKFIHFTGMTLIFQLNLFFLFAARDLLIAFSAKELRIDHRTGNSRWNLQRGILHVACFITEDSAQ